MVGGIPMSSVAETLRSRIMAELGKEATTGTCFPTYLCVVCTLYEWSCDV